ncbi:MAG: hypothetical protein K0S33_729 [Bacteroidetes bacterium]|jgi:hypothetical protein|nr:hypothetical protein [Bacteroidota bacterium]
MQLYRNGNKPELIPDRGIINVFFHGQLYKQRVNTVWIIAIGLYIKCINGFRFIFKAIVFKAEFYAKPFIDL